MVISMREAEEVSQSSSLTLGEEAFFGDEPMNYVQLI